LALLKKGAKMKQRIITGLIVFLIVASSFLLRELDLIIFDTFIAMAIVLATAEVSRVFIRSGKENFMELAVIYSIIVYLSLVYSIQNSFTLSSFLFIQLGILIVFFVMAFSFSYFRKASLKKNENYKQSKLTIYEYSLKKAFRTLFVMAYPTLLLSFLYLINHIKELRLTETGVVSYGPVDLGLIVLVMVFLVTMATDTFAYFVGRSIGGPKLAPLISPKKTISGSIGGILGSVLVASLIFLVLNNMDTFNTAFFRAEISIWHFIIYGFLASIISQAGDLFASVIKRRARAKDFSSILPGHGGFMDRLDGVSFNAVFTFIFVMLFFM
jgi:CDP-diglyceride synthetase